MAAAIDQQLVGTAAGFHHVSMLIDNDEDWELNDSVHARRMSFAPRARGVSLLEEDVGLHGHFDLDQMFFAKIADEESGSDFDSIADDYIQEHDIASVTRARLPSDVGTLGALLDARPQEVFSTPQPSSAHTHSSSSVGTAPQAHALTQQQGQGLYHTPNTVRARLPSISELLPRRPSQCDPIHITSSLPVSNPVFAPLSVNKGSSQNTVVAAASTAIEAVTVQAASTVRVRDADTGITTTATSLSTSSTLLPFKKGPNYIGRYSPEERKLRLRRFHEKRLQRKWGKRIKYQDRKVQAENQHRVRGRFAKLPPEVVLARRQAREAERAAKAEAKRVAKAAKLAAKQQLRGNKGKGNGNGNSNGSIKAATNVNNSILSNHLSS
eukprot:TRINITY_DN46_c0_g1_i2.p1 TRINITY_DN46_c0_g1~~TRINITY_DN46_c0_g1_i2.p1  ORF type:complete len:382 (-),score=111.05 TRINITY_DN46_c0_g1_i2:586-1731(-)